METGKITTNTPYLFDIAYQTGIVKAKATAAKGLRDLFIDSLKEMYWAEKALVKALPKFIRNTTNPNLIAVLIQHLEVTQQEVLRLENVFTSIDINPTAKRCDAMEGIIEEGEGMLEETQPGAVRDAAIIAASQKMEHYEIATYGTLVAFAKTLGQNEAAQLLKQTLNEKKESDLTLTKAAYNTINFDATAEE